MRDRVTKIASDLVSVTSVNPSLGGPDGALRSTSVSCAAPDDLLTPSVVDGRLVGRSSCDTKVVKRADILGGTCARVFGI